MRVVPILLALVTGCASKAGISRVAIEPQALPSTCVESVHLAEPVKKLPSDTHYTSNWGMVHRVETSGGWFATYPSGILMCTEAGDTSSCEWHEGQSVGHAAFVRGATGKLAGTWGTGASADDGGDWTLVPIVRGAGVSGLWETNFGAVSITTSGSHAHVTYPNGTMECDLARTPQIACDWTEGSGSGSAELVIESDQVIRGRWGTGTSTTDGGEWIFVRR